LGFFWEWNNLMSPALNVFTLPIFRNSENVKNNKERVHTWANGTGYTSSIYKV
jgi:hypothetical protein